MGLLVVYNKQFRQAKRHCTGLGIMQKRFSLSFCTRLYKPSSIQVGQSSHHWTSAVRIFDILIKLFEIFDYILISKFILIVILCKESTVSQLSAVLLLTMVMTLLEICILGHCNPPCRPSGRKINFIHRIIWIDSNHKNKSKRIQQLAYNTNHKQGATKLLKLLNNKFWLLRTAKN